MAVLSAYMILGGAIGAGIGAFQKDDTLMRNSGYVVVGGFALNLMAYALVAR